MLTNYSGDDLIRIECLNVEVQGFFSPGQHQRWPSKPARAGWSSPWLFELQMPRTPPETMPLSEKISQLDQVQSAAQLHPDPFESTDKLSNAAGRQLMRSVMVGWLQLPGRVAWLCSGYLNAKRTKLQATGSTGSPATGSYFRVAVVQEHGFEEV